MALNIVLIGGLIVLSVGVVAVFVTGLMSVRSKQELIESFIKK